MAESSRANQREAERLLKQPALNLQEMEAQPNDLANQLNGILEVAVLPQMSAEQCIYKVPQRIRQINPQAYTPQIIAIGPFHHPPDDINNNMREMERLKVKYYKGFLNRTNLLMKHLVSKLQQLETRIRNSYAEHFTLDSNEFLKIIIVDACFIIEHFYRWYNRDRYNARNDPIFSKPGLFREIERDLLLLENQLPFFVLEEIYNLGNLPAVGVPFIQVTMSYFQELNRQKLGFQNINPNHFTDLQRTFFLPTSNYERQTNNPIIRGELLYSASQLSDAGLKFQLREKTCLFDLEFVNGVLHMPCFNVSDTIETDMKNLLAFEECHILSLQTKYVSQYIRILDFLINTEKDVSILIDKKIIVHRLGDANEVATLINNLSRNVSTPTFYQRYIDMFNGLNGFYENSWNRNKAMLKREYFSTPWKTASTIIAGLLVVFTLIQAICSILSLVLKQPQ